MFGPFGRHEVESLAVVSILVLLAGGCVLGATQGGSGSGADGVAAALERGDSEAALGVATAMAERDPGDDAAWLSVVHAATLARGAASREAVGALSRSYAARPFASPALARWRVDWADAHWESVPDPLAEATLAQVRALGALGRTYDARFAWCRGARTAAIREAACATLDDAGAGRSS